MKLVVILVVSIVQFQGRQCRFFWNQNQIVEMVGNDTQVDENASDSESANWIGYFDKVKHMKSNVADYFTSKKLEISNKIDEYVTSARESGRKLVEKFAPKKEFCVYNPEVYLTTPELIVRNGYTAESHTVRTADGYLLTLHRIPRGKNDSSDHVSTKTVFLHHGLLGSSADWIVSGPGKALGYILADAGYDVWMGNVRGNTYSRAHVSLDTNSFEFWNFTWHELGYYDLPAAIDYINRFKNINQKINYIGHSMGTTALFVLLSTRPEYNKRLRAGYALAPVAYMSDIKSPLKYIAPFASNIEKIIKLFGANEFLPSTAVVKWIARHICEVNNFEEAVCENALFVLCGHDAKEFNKILLPVVLGHVPAGASTKTLVHYAQEIHEGGKFQKFDYGSEQNMKKYGSVTPPEYPVEDITLPIALLSARNDWLAGTVDVQKLFKKLRNPMEHYIVPMEEFNHIDFLWAIDAPQLVYKKVLELLEK